MSLKVYLQHAACSAPNKGNADFMILLILTSMLMSKIPGNVFSQAMADGVQTDVSALFAMTAHDCTSMHVTL